MKKIISLVLAFTMCFTALSGIMLIGTASADTLPEKVYHANEYIITQWDGDGDFTPSYTTDDSGNAVYTAYNIKGNDNSATAKTLAVSSFKTEDYSALTGTTDYLKYAWAVAKDGTMANEAGSGSYIYNNWFKLNASYNVIVSGDVNSNGNYRYVNKTRPNLSARYRIYIPSTDTNKTSEHYAELKLGTAKSGSDILNLRTAFKSGYFQVQDRNASTSEYIYKATIDAADRYDKWHDVEIVVAFAEGDAAKQPVYVYLDGEKVVECVTSVACVLADGNNQVYLSSFGFTNGSSTAASNGLPKNIYPTYYDDITISAFADEYDVVFDLGGGTCADAVDGKYLASATTALPTDVTKDGYTFTGWTLNGETVTTISASGTYVANWEKNAKATYAVTYDLNGGTCADATDGTYEDGTALPTEGEKYGYEFAGWKLNDVDVTTVTGEGTYVAQWTALARTATSTLVSQWNDMLGGADAGKLTGRTFVLAGSYKATEGNTAGAVTDEGTLYGSVKVHAPQFQCNYYKSPNSYAATNESVVSYSYKMYIPNDNYKEELRKFVIKFGDSSSDDYAGNNNQITLVVQDGFMSPGNSSNVDRPSRILLETVYDEWIDVEVVAHYVAGSYTDYKMYINGTLVANYMDTIIRTTECGINQIQYTQNYDTTGVATYTTYYKDAVIETRNCPVEIIKSGDNLTAYAGATGCEGILILAIYDADGKLVKLYKDDTATDGLYSVSAESKYLLEGYSAKAFIWDSLTSIIPQAENAERVLLQY